MAMWYLLEILLANLSSIDSDLEADRCFGLFLSRPNFGRLFFGNRYILTLEGVEHSDSLKVLEASVSSSSTKSSLCFRMLFPQPSEVFLAWYISSSTRFWLGFLRKVLICSRSSAHLIRGFLLLVLILTS